MAYQARIRSTWSAFVACCWTKSPSGPSTICDAELWHWKPNGTDGEWRMSVTSCKLCSMFHSNSHNLSNRKVKTLPSVRFLHANSLFSLYPIQTLLNIHFTDLTEGNSLGEILVLVNRQYTSWRQQRVVQNFHGLQAVEPFTFLQLGKSRGGPVRTLWNDIMALRPWNGWQSINGWSLVP